MTASRCLEPGGLSRALLGQRDPVLVSNWGTGAAAAYRAAMEEFAKAPQMRNVR